MWLSKNQIMWKLKERLSQDELTKKVGYKSRQFIADIENNKTKPSFDFVMTFALIFKKLTKLPFSFVNLANPAKDYKAVFESKFTEKSSINYDMQVPANGVRTDKRVCVGKSTMRI